MVTFRLSESDDDEVEAQLGLVSGMEESSGLYPLAASIRNSQGASSSTAPVAGGDTSGLLQETSQEDNRGEPGDGSALEYQPSKQRLQIFAAVMTVMVISTATFLYLTDVQPDLNCTDDPSGVNATAPEGPIQANFLASHDYRGRPRVTTGSRGAVAADHGRCSDMGLAILQESGNAVDAAVTVALCQGVYNAGASGVGGGGFITLRLPNGSAEVIDARETAPAAASRDMYKGHPELAVHGGLAVAVPLELKGLAAAHARHGSLNWSRLVQPIIPLARDGFPAHPYLVAALSSNASLASIIAAPGMAEVWLIRDGGDWRAPKINETCCRRPQLAALLTDVAMEGVDVLYDGKYTAELAAEVQAAGGLLTAADLRGARVEVRSAITARVLGMELVLPPPPSSAAALVTALNILAGPPLTPADVLPMNAEGGLGAHRVVEAMKHAFALRMSLGDPGPDPAKPFVNVTAVLGDMLSPEFAAELRADIKDNTTQNVTEYGGKWNQLRGMKSDAGTSHFSIVDADHMAVGMTTTINTGFGALVLSNSTGILLNNEMDDFSTPDQPNIYGLPPAPANFIRPGKKPLSSMAPVIAVEGGRLRAVVGGSGGPLIISSVLQTLLRLLALKEAPLAAVSAARLHHQLLPDNVFAENWTARGVDFVFPAKEISELRARHHNVTTFPFGAINQAILLDVGTQVMTAVSDPRKDGAPAAY